jgi:hypothetical protein
MKTICSSETSVGIQRATEDRTVHNHGCENLKYKYSHVSNHSPEERKHDSRSLLQWTAPGTDVDTVASVTLIWDTKATTGFCSSEFTLAPRGLGANKWILWALPWTHSFFSYIMRLNQLQRLNGLRDTRCKSKNRGTLFKRAISTVEFDWFTYLLLGSKVF